MFRIDKSRRVAGFGAVLLLGGLLVGGLELKKGGLRSADGGDRGSNIDPNGLRLADVGNKGSSIDPNGCKRIPHPDARRPAGAVPLV